MKVENSVLDELEDLLERERTFLLAGEIEHLERIMNQKIRLLKKVAASTDTKALERIGAKARRNASLLGAASKGIKSVVERLAQIRKGPSTLVTYSSDGQRSSLGASVGSIKHRA